MTEPKSKDKKIVIDKHAYIRMKDIAYPKAQQHYRIYRDFILLEALHEFIQQNGGTPGFEIIYPDEYFSE